MQIICAIACCSHNPFPKINTTASLFIHDFIGNLLEINLSVYLILLLPKRARRFNDLAMLRTLALAGGKRFLLGCRTRGA